MPISAIASASPRADLTFDRRDNASGMPKCVVVEPAFTWGNDRRLAHRWHETVVYELHVRGFTMLHPGVPPACRGTFAGLSSPAVVEYLPTPRGHGGRTAAGARRSSTNAAWSRRGCATTGATTRSRTSRPNRAICRPASVKFKTMVKPLHAAGIEVILDVVYNHTAEGNQLGPDAVVSRHRQQERTTGWSPTTSALRGLHRLRQHARPRHPRVLQLVMDSLRYWVERDARRRLPLRSRADARARRQRRLRRGAARS